MQDQPALGLYILVHNRINDTINLSKSPWTTSHTADPTHQWSTTMFHSELGDILLYVALFFHFFHADSVPHQNVDLYVLWSQHNKK